MARGPAPWDGGSLILGLPGVEVWIVGRPNSTLSRADNLSGEARLHGDRGIAAGPAGGRRPPSGPATTRRSPGSRLTLWPSRVPSPPGRTAVVLHHAEDALTPANARHYTDRAHGHRTRDGTEEGSRVGGDHSHGARGAGVLWLDPGSGHRGRAGSAPSHWLRAAAPSGGARRQSPTSATRPARTWHHHRARHPAPWLGQA